MALYTATDGPNWTSSTNWNTDEPISTWRGVTTDTTGRVTSLHLSYISLSGEIPAEIGDLTSLQTLSLSRNSLSGSIPAEIGDLTNLLTLWPFAYSWD